MIDSPETQKSADADGFLFSRALRAALGRAPQWLFCWLVLWALAWLVALPWHGALDEVLRGRYPASAEVHSFDVIFRADQRELLERLQQSGAAAGAVLALLSALFGVFVGGGWLAVVLERTDGHSLRRFFHGGARYWWRFLRVWLCFLLLLSAVWWLFYGWPWDELVLGRWLGLAANERRSLESLDSELLVHRLRWLQAAGFALGFALLHAWALYTRARLALLDARSVLLAGIASAWSMLCHPIRSLRPLVLLFLLEVGVLLAAGLATRWLDARLALAPSLAQILLLHAVSQAALLWRQIGRGAAYHAVAQVSHELLPATQRPEPWQTIGGPGGPQYPVDGGTDEYNVAL